MIKVIGSFSNGKEICCLIKFCFFTSQTFAGIIIMSVIPGGRVFVTFYFVRSFFQQQDPCFCNIDFMRFV